MKFFKKLSKKDEKEVTNSRDAAKERLHLVLMQDRANVSADFLELMKQEIIDVIKKYIDIDEGAIDVRLTNQENEDGTNGAPALYANIPIVNIKNEARKAEQKVESQAEEQKKEDKTEEANDTIKEEENQENKEIEDKNEEEKIDNKEDEKEEKAEIIIDDGKNEEEEKKEESTEDAKEELKSEN